MIIKCADLSHLIPAEFLPQSTHAAAYWVMVTLGRMQRSMEPLKTKQDWQSLCCYVVYVDEKKKERLKTSRSQQ